MRALVTGAGGFIGSALSAQLLSDGWAVRGVDAFTESYDPSLKRQNVALLAGHRQFELIETDLFAGSIEPLLDDVDVVFHLAGQPGVRDSWAVGFASYERANVIVTQRLLEATRDRSLRRIVFASSSSVYGNASRVPTREEDPTRPYSPYGVTKLAGEHLCRAYSDNFGLPVTILRYFTVYGPRQRPDMAIHRLIESARRGTPFHVYGDGCQLRDFTFVDDVVAASIAAAVATAAPGETMNIAGGASTRLIDLIEVVGQAVGASVPIEWRPAQPGDVVQTRGAIERAAAILGWEPKVPIRNGVARQVEWHLANVG